MVFWKLHAEKGLSYEQTPKHAFHISQAVLDLESEISEEKTSVIIGTNDEEAVVCHLNINCDQVSLDLNFEKGEPMKIWLVGKSNVYLTGYTLDKNVSFNELDGEVSKKKKKVPVSFLESPSPKQNGLPAREKGFLVKSKSEKATASQNEISEQKVSKKCKKAKKSEEASNQNEKSNEKKKSGKKTEDADISSILMKSYDEDDDDDEEYVLEEEESVEVEEEEEDDEDEEMEEEEAEEEEQVDNNDEEIENLNSSEDQDEVASMKSPKMRKRPLISPPSSAGRTPMVRSSNKARKQQEESPSELPEGSLKKKRKGMDSPAEELGSSPPSSKTKKQIKKGGLVCEDIKIGNGQEAKNGKKLIVYYEGKLKNGHVFDKMKSGSGFRFKLGASDVIKAWDVGIEGMKVGGIRKIVAPPSMAYGKEGHSPEIPSNAFLTFVVELKSVK